MQNSVLHAENVLFWLLGTNSGTTTSSYRQAWNGETPTDYRKLEMRNNGEYLVLTDEEADRIYEECLENYIDDVILPEIASPYQNYFDRERWLDDAHVNLSRGQELNIYDGSEDYMTVNNTDYYIYRTN